MPELLQFPTSHAATTDAAVRTEALDIRRSFIVEAPAGSGKTGLLVQRMLRLLGDTEVAQPEEVLAMTFTRKATAEMQQRVLKELRNARDQTPVSDEYDRETRALAETVLQRHDPQGQPWALLDRPQRLNIRSILSVCMDLSRAQPLLSGGSAEQPVEDANPLHRAAARNTFLALGGDDPALTAALRTVLLHRDGSLADCESLIANMLESREQWGELIPLEAAFDDHLLDTVVRPRLEEILAQIVCTGLSRALAVFPPHLLQETAAVGARIGAAPPYKDYKPVLSLCADKHLPPEAMAEHLDHWRALIDMLLTKEHEWRKSANRGHLGHDFDSKTDGILLKNLLADLKDHPGADAVLAALCAVRALPPTRYPDEQWEVAKALFLVLRRALAELKILFAERGECDFTELSLRARAILRGQSPEQDDAQDTGPDNATDRALGGRLRHLLVDEMQDTSTAQYELIELLTRSWDGHSQTLFLVGDPKQSIYLFRQARVEHFLHTLRVGCIGSGRESVQLAPLALTANFRSQRHLVDGFNTIFSRIFPAAAELAEDVPDVPFVAAEAVRKATADPGVAWHPTLLGVAYPDGTDPDPAATEAREIVQIIQQRLAMPLPAGRTKPWRIAVLARGRAHLASTVTELKRQGIPFRAVNLDPLDERPEVLDALALTRALLHPADRVAWLAVLRAPWCGLGLADLLALTGEGDSTGHEASTHEASTHEASTREATLVQLVEGRRDRLSATAQRLLARAWPVLLSGVATLGSSPLATQVERTWRSLGGDACLTPDARLNLQRYLSLLREAERETTGLDLHALTRRLKTLFAEPLAGDHIRVDLQTIHSAKGLEWDLVLVPGLHRRARGNQAPLLNWLELDAHASSDEAAIVLAPIGGKGADSDQLNEWLKRLRNQRELAEVKRLFYVVSTRAREELHLFAALPLNAAGEPANPATGTLLHACWPAAQPHFAKLVAATDRAQPDNEEPLYDQPLALAASAQAALIERLPLGFDPAAAFAAAAARRLPYPAAAVLAQAKAFDRPEGSFAVRAFGNVVHRYLQVLADRLLLDPPAALAAELPAWRPRLEASLRGEGLPPRDAEREAARSLQALTRTIADPAGLWLLSPHPQAASESSLTALGPVPIGLRVDRTFLAGPAPLAPGDNTLWIIDFKTTEQGSLPDQTFDAQQRARYSAQLEVYAQVRRNLPAGDLSGDPTIRLGLYFPLASRLIDWTAGSI